MQIVIDVPEQIKNALNNEDQWTALLLAELKDIINNGQVLPKGHGRLYDEKVLHDYWGEKYDLPHIPCVVEADKPKITPPSCLTNQERYEELMERYKE